MSDAKTLRQILSENMRIMRNSIAISQEDLAARCGLHRTYISDIERCARNVSIDNIERIAKALRLSPSELLKEDLFVNH